MNHIFLPGIADLDRVNEPARYGVNAMELLINRMMQLGAPRNRLNAKVFGGGHLFPGIPEGNWVGKKIATFVFAFLDREKIRIINHDLGGTKGRKILFHTDTGDVYLKRISPMLLDLYSKEEKRRIKRLRENMKKTGEITLFL